MPQQKEKPKMNLIQKLDDINKHVQYLKKDASGFNYQYTSEDTVLANVKTWMMKNHVALTVDIEPGTVKEEVIKISKRKTPKGIDPYFEENIEIKVSGQLNFTWIDVDNTDDRITVPWYMVGQQGDPSQAFGSALTYAQRYFLLKYFNIATSNLDPDEYRTKQKEAEQNAERQLRDDIIKELDTAIRSFLTANPDKKKDVKDFCAKYVADGKYVNIRESAVAAKVLADFKTNFLKEEN